MPLPTAPFNVLDTLVSGLQLFQFKPQNSSLTAIAVATATGIATKVAHGLKVGQQFIVTSLTGGTGIILNNYYWVLTAPTADTFTFAATRGGTTVIPSVAATAMAIQPVWVFETQELKRKGALEEKTMQRAVANGMSFPVRTWATSASEEYQATIQDIKRQVDMFGGQMLGRMVGTGTLWKRDIDDATNIVALVSEADFPCTCYSDGDSDIGGATETKGTLRIKSNKAGMLTFERDKNVA